MRSGIGPPRGTLRFDRRFLVAVSADHVGAGHGFFGFGDEAAALADDRELGEGEGVVGFDFGDAFGVLDGLFLATESMQMDGQGGVRYGVVGVEFDSLEPLGNGGLKIAGFLEFERFVVNLVLCSHRSVCLC